MWIAATILNSADIETWSWQMVLLDSTALEPAELDSVSCWAGLVPTFPHIRQNQGTFIWFIYLGIQFKLSFILNCSNRYSRHNI